MPKTTSMLAVSSLVLSALALSLSAVALRDLQRLRCGEPERALAGRDPATATGADALRLAALEEQVQALLLELNEGRWESDEGSARTPMDAGLRGAIEAQLDEVLDERLALHQRAERMNSARLQSLTCARRACQSLDAPEDCDYLELAEVFTAMRADAVELEARFGVILDIRPDDVMWSEATAARRSYLTRYLTALARLLGPAKAFRFFDSGVDTPSLWPREDEARELLAAEGIFY